MAKIFLDLARLDGRADLLGLEPVWTTVDKLQLSTDDTGYRNGVILAYISISAIATDGQIRFLNLQGLT